MICNLTAPIGDESAGQATKCILSIRWSGSGQQDGGKVRQASQHNASCCITTALAFASKALYDSSVALVQSMLLTVGMPRRHD